MTPGAERAPRHDTSERRSLAFIGTVLGFAVCLPNLLGVASGSEVAQALWFATLAMVVPALVALGASRSRVTVRGTGAVQPGDGRVRLKAAVALLVDLVAVVCWRTPVLVDALARHPGLVLVEATTLVLPGVGLWLGLVDHPAGAPQLPRPWRAVLAALTMWTVWVLAYLGGMSSTGWYDAFHHVAGVGLSAAADRQVSAAVLWAVAAVAFVPVVFWNLLTWLRTESGAQGQPLGLAASLGRSARSAPTK